MESISACPLVFWLWTPPSKMGGKLFKNQLSETWEYCANGKENGSKLAKSSSKHLQLARFISIPTKQWIGNEYKKVPPQIQMMVMGSGHLITKKHDSIRQTKHIIVSTIILFFYFIVTIEFKPMMPAPWWLLLSLSQDTNWFLV